MRTMTKTEGIMKNEQVTEPSWDANILYSSVSYSVMWNEKIGSLFAEELPLVSKVNANLQESAYNLLKGLLVKLKDGFYFVSGNLETATCLESVW